MSEEKSCNAPTNLQSMEYSHIPRDSTTLPQQWSEK
jgi:hypothetical protein